MPKEETDMEHKKSVKKRRTITGLGSPLQGLQDSYCQSDHTASDDHDRQVMEKYLEEQAEKKKQEE